MARPLRIEYPGAVYHVTSRGNQGHAVFPDDAHRRAFLDILSSTIRRYNWLCYAYCLMDNHYHLLVETPEGNLSQGMRQVNGIYTQYANRQSGEGGHLFQGRYKAILVEKDAHLLEVARYVLLNPVRAGMTAGCADWPWSSYRGTCGIEEPMRFLSVEPILDIFGEDRDAAVRRFEEFMADGLAVDTPWRNVRGQVLLGGEAFCAELAGQLKEKSTASEVPRAQRLAGRPALVEIFAGCGKKSLRDPKIAEAVTTYGYSQKEIADFLDLHYSSISRILSAIESRSPVVSAPAVPEITVAASHNELPQVVPAKTAVKKVAEKIQMKEKAKEKETPVSVNQLSLF